MKSFREKYIGDKAFYKMLMSVVVPIMVQNGITNFVSLLDNIMVGRIGTEQMSGVAIVNQILFIYYLCLFGGLSGAGIFTAQFFGYKDDRGIRHTFRYKLWMGLIITAAAIVIMAVFGTELVGLYLNESSSGGDVFNYLLIYGKLGFPEMGVYGAAIATSLSRVVECVILMTWLHTHSGSHTYIRGVYRTLKIPFNMVRQFFVTGAPLLVNETLWAIGIFLLNQAYSLRGLNVVAGQNIANTINNVFNIAFIALGDAVAIIVGQLLGAGKMKEAKDTDTKIIAASLMISVVLMVLMIVTAPLFPRLYNTNEEAKHLATMFLIVQGLATPKDAFLHTSYFTLRSGGKTIITFLFDSVFMCLVSVPVAYVLSRFTGLHVIAIFAIVHAADLIKCVIGYVLVKKNVWMKNIVA